MTELTQKLMKTIQPLIISSYSLCLVLILFLQWREFGKLSSCMNMENITSFIYLWFVLAFCEPQACTNHLFWRATRNPLSSLVYFKTLTFWLANSFVHIYVDLRTLHNCIWRTYSLAKLDMIRSKHLEVEQMVKVDSIIFLQVKMAGKVKG